MAADLLLTHGYSLYEDEKELQIMKPYPPLGLLYISAYLRRAGIDVQIFDTTFATREQLWGRFATTPGGVVGLYTNLMTRAPVLDVIRHAKRHDWTVVCGGPEAVNYPREYLEHGADVVVVGEGEVTMAELLPALDRVGPHRLHDVRGTVFRDEEGAVVTTPARAQIPDLNDIPWPDRDQIDIRRYVEVWRDHHGMGSVNMYYRPGLSVSLQVVLARGVRVYAPSAQPCGLRRRIGAHLRRLPAGSGVVRRRCLHDPSSLVVPVRS